MENVEKNIFEKKRLSFSVSVSPVTKKQFIDKLRERDYATMSEFIRQVIREFVNDE